MAKKGTSLPRDDNHNPMQIVPAVVPLAVTRDTSISSSTSLALNASTSFIEVTAIDGNVYLLWGTGTASNSSFSEFILAGTTRHYKVPNDISALRVIDDGDSAAVVIIEK